MNKDMKKGLLITAVFLALIFVAVKFFNINFPGISQRASYPPVTMNPTLYYEFDEANPKTAKVGSESFGSGAGLGGATTEYVLKTGGPVGKYIYTEDGYVKSFNIGTVSFPTSNMSVVFNARIKNFDDEVTWFRTNDQRFSLSLGYGNPYQSVPYIRFETKHTGGIDQFDILLNGVGPKSLSYYLDANPANNNNYNGNWHQFAFVVEGNVKKLYIDGVLPDGFSKTVSTPLISGGSSTFDYNGYENFNHFNGDLDSLAIYNQALPANMVYQLKQNLISSANFATSTIIPTVPSAQPTSGGINEYDFLPNANLSTTATTTYPKSGTTFPSTLKQSRTYHLPMYTPNHTLLRHSNWNDQAYLHQDVDTENTTWVSSQQSYVNKAVAWSAEISKKNHWNYYFPIENLVSPNPTDLPAGNGQLCQYQSNWTLVKGLLNYANTVDTNVPLSLITNRAGLKNYSLGCIPKLRTEDLNVLDSNHYLQNSSGNHVNLGHGSRSKYWRPFFTNTADYASDGVTVKTGLELYRNTYLNNRINSVPLIADITENGEIAGTAPDFYNNTVMANDPGVLAGCLAKGFSADMNCWNAAYANNEIESYRKQFIDNVSWMNGANFTLYKMGKPNSNDNNWVWGQVRNIQTPIVGNSRPATTDLYTQTPNVWDTKYSSWNGLYGIRYTVNATHKDCPSGTVCDKFMKLYYGMSYSPNIINGIMASQQLGMVKLTQNMGSIAGYAAWFNEVSDYGGVRGMGQVKSLINYILSYAQAPISYMQNFYENSDVMPGDRTLELDAWTQKTYGYVPTQDKLGYMFRTGRANVAATVRKANDGSKKYMISVATMRVSNQDGQIPEVTPTTIKLDGENIYFDSYPQGAIYYYDNTNSSNPIFYQLDKWHNKNHPAFWSEDFAIEAEMFNPTSTSERKTEGNGITNRNFTNGNYTTYISKNSANYTFEPRYFDENNYSSNGTPSTWYVWYNAKSGGGTSTGTISVDGGTAKTISTSLTGFEWCNKDNLGQVLSFPSLANNTEHTLTFTGVSPSLYMDKFLLTKNPNLNLGNCTTQVMNNIPPVLTLTSPTGGPSITSQVATLSGVAGTAVDSDGTVASVTWSNSVAGIVVSSGTATGANSWTIPSAIALSSGLNIITISATDDKGGVGTSTLSVTYTPPSDLAGPVVALTSPLNNANLTGTVNLAATVTDVAGVGSVGFYYKQGTAPGIVAAGSVNSNGSAYTLAWNTSGITNGTYSLYVVAIDTLGNTTSTTPITVNINNVIVNPDTTIPNITIVNPITDQIISGSVNLQATASDPLVANQAQSGVSFVKFEYKKTSETNYTNLGNSTGSNSTYNYTLDTVGLTNGTYNIKMTAVDGNANSNPKSIIVTINNSVAYPDLIVEQFNVNSVAPGTPITFSATIKNIGTVATPTNSSIHRVLFTVDGNSVTWSNNYTQSIAPGQSVVLTANSGLTNATWTPTTAGTYQVVATVNNTGIITESNTGNNSSLPQALVVSAAPSVSWVTPINNTEVELGETYELKVQTTGNVAYVKISKNLLSIPVVLNSANNWAKPWKISLTAKEGKQVTWKAVGYDVNNNPITSEVLTTVTRVLPTP